MVIRMRHTKSHTKNRRSHHAISRGGVSVCPECGASKMAHRACMACGSYRGRKVVGKKETVKKESATEKEPQNKKTKTEAKKSK